MNENQLEKINKSMDSYSNEKHILNTPKISYFWNYISNLFEIPKAIKNLYTSVHLGISLRKQPPIENIFLPQLAD